MDQTPNLTLPYIMPSQAQKHVTHNEAIRALDALVQLAVADRDRATPPGAPAEGERHIVAAGASDGWTGRDGAVAAFQDGAWAFYAPLPGWVAWVEAEGRLVAFDGADWIEAAGVNPVAMVGVNATADTTDRLSVKSPATLLDAETDDHRLKINKAAGGDTASVLFQTGYSGRAEFGLTGDDDWHVKVSADGAAWVEALTVDRASGRVRLPAALALADPDQAVAARHVRERLTANRTYHVRADGSDANDGLANSAGRAFATIQKAVDTVVSTLDLGGRSVTVSVGAGTYAAGAQITQPWTGGGTLAIQGDTATPANVVIAATATQCFRWACNLPGTLTIAGFKVQTTGSGDAIRGDGAGVCTLRDMEYGACAGRHILGAVPGARFTFGGSVYTITGDAQSHWAAESLSNIRCDGRTITLAGSRAFSAAFATAHFGGIIQCGGDTFVGAATGRRHLITTAGGIHTNGGGAAYLPGSGSPADIVTSPGWYM